MKVRIYNESGHGLPSYETKGSAGMDLRANLKESVTIRPGGFALIPTGIHIELPDGYEARVQARSGLACKKGIGIVNGLGCIDSDYRGDIGIILINFGKEDFVVNDGDRVGQLIVSKYEKVKWEPAQSLAELSETERGSGGFGHSGVK